MNNQVEIKKSFPIGKQELFRYFTDKALVEKWSAPDGMTLKLPTFDARPGGKYRYEHTNQEGMYICEGHFEEVSPERIVQVDEYIKTPKGELMAQNLKGEILLTENGGETDVKVIQSGFTDEKFAEECQQGWKQSFAKLDKLIGGEEKLERTA